MNRLSRKTGTGGRYRLCGLIGSTLALLATSSVVIMPAAADDRPVLTQIAETGILRAGTRASATPFARQTGPNSFEGFSVDLLEEIRAATARQLGRDVRLALHAVTPTDRLDLVAAGELDLVCGITTPTWEREALVDFSIPFFRDGTRILAYRRNANIDVGQMTIAVVEGTTTVNVVRDTLPLAPLVTFSTMQDAMQALSDGSVQGVANVGVVLLGLAQQQKPRRSVVLLPRTQSLKTETLACVLPEDDSAWRDLVNNTLVRTFRGLDQFTGRYDEIYRRWFGRTGLLYYPLDRANRRYLSELPIWVD